MKSPRDNQIVDAVLSGHSRASLARKHELSRQRVSKILDKHAQEKREAMELGPAAALCLRVRNCLLAAGIGLDVTSVHQAFERGLLEDLPNFGKVSKREVAAWLSDHL